MGFETEIRPLFRELDREEMVDFFDLWSYEDVRAHASLILERVDDGSMPCDQPWEAASVEAFRRWVEGGCQA